MLGNLLSRGACALYDELAASDGLPVDDPAGIPGHHQRALAELSSHGLLWESAGPPRRVRVVSHAVALRRLISSRQREVAEAHRQLADHYRQLEELESRPATTAATRLPAVELLQGSDRVLARLHDLVAGARRECRALQAGGPPGPLGDWSALHAGARDTVAFRVIGTPDLLRPGAARAGGTADLRILPELTVHLALVDDAALVPAGAAPDTALLVRTPALVDPLGRYFDLLWHAAVPAASGPPAAGDVPAPVEMQVLRLAATGLKDEAIARALGRSSRWVRRHMESLEERLGATNRLTLGIAAARRGWV